MTRTSKNESAKRIGKKIENAFHVIHDAIKNPDKYGDDSIVLLLDDDDIAALFTKERLRLIRLVRERSFSSISELAHEVGRDVSRVKKDLGLLEKHGIVHLTRDKNCVTVHTMTKGIFIPLEIA
jgi:predicted transcriptional regulator